MARPSAKAVIRPSSTSRYPFVGSNAAARPRVWGETALAPSAAGSLGTPGQPSVRNHGRGSQNPSAASQLSAPPATIGEPVQSAGARVSFRLLPLSPQDQAASPSPPV